MVGTLSNRPRLCSAGTIIKPGDVKCVANEGMPIYRNPTQRGKLVIQFQVWKLLGGGIFLGIAPQWGMLVRDSPAPRVTCAPLPSRSRYGSPIPAGCPLTSFASSKLSSRVARR